MVTMVLCSIHSIRACHILLSCPRRIRWEVEKKTKSSAKPKLSPSTSELVRSCTWYLTCRFAQHSYISVKRVQKKLSNCGTLDQGLPHIAQLPKINQTRRRTFKATKSTVKPKLSPSTSGFVRSCTWYLTCRFAQHSYISVKRVQKKLSNCGTLDQGLPHIAQLSKLNQIGSGTFKENTKIVPNQNCLPVYPGSCALVLDISLAASRSILISAWREFRRNSETVIKTGSWSATAY